MTNPCETLISHAETAVAFGAYDYALVEEAFSTSVATLLQPLLSRWNGFFAFDRALHVISSDALSPFGGIVGWNSQSLWTGEYGGLLSDTVCFAQDVFGVQFCIRDNTIQSFNPETAEFTSIATSIETWAGLLLEDAAFLLGSNIATEWRARYGLLSSTERLGAKMPFILGGEYSIDNLYAREAVDLMRAVASIGMQIKDLPDGARVRLVVTD